MLGDRVSIVVVSFNTRELLLECLSSATRYAPDAEIMVVDNASSDGSVAAVWDRFPDIRIIENQENRGFAAACNQAIRSANADFFLLLNSDALLTEGVVSELLQCMTANPRAGVAGCLVVNSNGHASVTTMNFLGACNQTLELLGLKIPGFRRTRPTPCQTEQCDCNVDWIEASCLLLRRAALDEIGLFDEQFFMYSEDEDLCWRLRNAKWLICYTRGATVKHLGGASSSADRPANLEHFYSSQIKLLRKHRSELVVRLFLLSTRLALQLKLLRSTALSDHTAAAELRLRLGTLKRARACLRNVEQV